MGTGPPHTVSGLITLPPRQTVCNRNVLNTALSAGVSCVGCRADPFLESRGRLAAPLARRQRQALPLKARPAHAGPATSRVRIQEAHATSVEMHVASSSPPTWPARNHDVYGRPAAARDRAMPTTDRATAKKIRQLRESGE
jgi:hypothetical protein